LNRQQNLGKHELASQFLNFGWATWQNVIGTGTQNVQLYMFVPIFFWGLIGQYDFAVKFTHLWPIAIFSLLAPYYLIKEITKDKKIAFFSALVYGFSTYLIMRSCTHLFIAFVYSMAPLILLSFVFFLKRTTYFRLIVFALLYSLGTFYELRIMYILSFVLFVYFLVFFEKRKVFQNKIKFIVLVNIILLLNMFWILPTVLGNNEAILAVINRGLWGSGYYTFLKSLAFFEWRWSGSEYIQGFIAQPILLHIWVVPIISFVAFFQFKNESKENKKYIIFFGIISLLGILLSKQAGEPFSNLYLWLYENFPGFSLFREASKFYLLLGVGYLGLFAFGLKFIFCQFQNFLVAFDHGDLTETPHFLRDHRTGASDIEDSKAFGPWPEFFYEI